MSEDGESRKGRKKYNRGVSRVSASWSSHVLSGANEKEPGDVQNRVHYKRLHNRMEKRDKKREK